MPRILLSYSHDSAAHAERVLRLANRLRGDGIDAWIDQYDPAPSEGWPLWMERRVEESERVIAVCTRTYRRRFDDRDPEGGLGVRWEGAILRGELYRRRPDFVVPVVFDRGDLAHVPTSAREQTGYVLPGDYEKLYRHLTGQPLTPAPPLGKIQKLPRRSYYGESVKEDEDPKLGVYRAWAKTRFRHVDLIGLGQGEMRLDLDEIYVPLRVAGRSRRRLESQERKAGKKPAVEQSPEPRPDSSRLDHDFQVEKLFLHLHEPHAVVLGEPGSGKTTALHKLHKVCAAQDPQSLGLEAETLPVFVRLRTLTRDQQSGVPLAACLERELAEASGGRLPDGVGEALIRHGRLLFLFDGLDEVAEESHREDALRYLLWALDSLENARAVISCRHGGWSSRLEKLDLRNAARLDVRPLDDDQIRELVERWHREAARAVRHYSMQDALAAAAKLNQTLLHDREYSSQQIQVLVSTPLLLTLLCLVVMRGGEIPKRRADFYEECVRVLLGSWRQQTGRRAPAEPNEMAQALELLAFFLHRHQRKEDLEIPEALGELKNHLGWKPRHSRQVIEWLWRDAALLDRFSQRHYGFPHLGLQEHLAARHLASSPEAFDQIGDDYAESWWREVLLLLTSLPERSTFGPLARFLLERGALDNAQGLFRDCLRGASRLDLKPLRQALLEEEADGQHALLQLFASRPEEAVLDLVQDFLDGDRARNVEVRRHAESLLEARAESRSRPEGVFLAHSTNIDAAQLEKLERALDACGLKVLNPSDWPPWRDCEEHVENAASVLIILGTDAEGEDADPGAAELADVYEIPAWVVRMPGESPAPIPETLAERALIEVSWDFHPSSFDALAQSLYSRPYAGIKSTLRGGGSFSLGVPAGDEDLFRGASTRSASSPSLGVSKRLSPEIGEPFTEPITGERFLPVPAGRFQMGGGAYYDEGPIHSVRLSDFWLARTPVTNRQYALFLEATDREAPAYWKDRRFSDPQQPVVGVTWEDATVYCEWLSSASEDALTFLLPTEAQWEYAARGSDGREYPWGDHKPTTELADFDRIDEDGPHPVGDRANGSGPFGHLDLAGTVFEWCRDSWEEDYSRWATGEALDPVGRVDPNRRPLRGGSWSYEEHFLRSAFRVGEDPNIRENDNGFRICCLPRLDT